MSRQLLTEALHDEFDPLWNAKSLNPRQKNERRTLFYRLLAAVISNQVSSAKEVSEETATGTGFPHMGTMYKKYSPSFMNKFVKIVKNKTKGNMSELALMTSLWNGKLQMELAGIGNEASLRKKIDDDEWVKEIRKKMQSDYRAKKKGKGKNENSDEKNPDKNYFDPLLFLETDEEMDVKEEEKDIISPDLPEKPQQNKKPISLSAEDLFIEALILRMNEKYQEASKKFKQALEAGYKEANKSEDDEKKLTPEKKKQTESNIKKGEYFLGLAFMYLEDNDKQNYVTSLKVSVACGNMYAQNIMGILFYQGQLVKQNFKQAIALFKKSANQGCMESMHSLGCIYDRGKIINQDFGQAFHWYQKAAKLGEDDSQYNLAFFYLEGKIVEQNDTEAFRLCKKSAERGHREAQYNFGVFYEDGTGTEKNFGNAIYWYTMSAKQGHAKAERILGDYYYEKRDFKNAAYWYEKSAKQGVASAQNNLGQMYTSNEFGNDYKKAFHWFRKAAEQEFPSAEYYLGTLYQKGLGVKQSNSDALFWQKRSIIHGFLPDLRELSLEKIYQEEVGQKPSNTTNATNTNSLIEKDTNEKIIELE